jgi:hypothetical protein
MTVPEMSFLVIKWGNLSDEMHTSIYKVLVHDYVRRITFYVIIIIYIIIIIIIIIIWHSSPFWALASSL